MFISASIFLMFCLMAEVAIVLKSTARMNKQFSGFPYKFHDPTNSLPFYDQFCHIYYSVQWTSFENQLTG